MKSVPRLCVLVATLLLVTGAAAHAQLPYKEGPVVSVSFIRTAPGQFDSYMSYIFSDYARLMNAYKEAGIILDWGVLETETRSPDEANVVLTTTYPNMAALDNLDERTDPIVQRVMGRNRQQSAQATVERGAMRVVIGSQLYRVLDPR